MARHSSQPITSLNQDWNFDPIEQLPFSGAAVQAFIKSYLGAVAKASYFDSSTNTMYWFASDDDKQSFIQDPTLTNLVLFSTTLSFSSELFRIALTNNTGSTNINVATNEEHVYLNLDFDVQTKSMTETAWRSTGKGVYISVQVDAGAFGEWETVMNPTFYAAETNFNFDARDEIIVGQNRVKVNFVAEDDDSVVASITYTIAMTEMYIEPMNNEWYVPIVETGDIANYKLGGFRIIGSVSKTLHLDIYSGDNKLLQFTKSLGTTAYDRVPYYYTQTEGLDLSSLQSGVYLVSAYLTSGTLISAPVNYNIIYIAEGDETTAQFVAINEAADVVFNYTTSTLFKYCLYNKGTLTASPHVVVKEIQGTTPTVIVDNTINDVSTGAEHTYEVALEWLTEETLNLFVQGEITFGNEQITRARLDNSATFPPTYGYEFYLNAAARANSDTNKLKIVNAVNHAELTPTWTNMVWLDGIDGWTFDDTNRQCLYLPARTKMVLPYSQYKILNGENITVEMCYRVANVTDYDEIAISIMDNLESLGFTGIRIKPTNITVHSSLDTSDVNDLVRGTNLIDESVVHFVLTVYPNFSGNNGKNLVTGYINGCKNFQFDYDTGAIWNTNADLRIGCERSDISLYFVRVYRSVLSDAAVQANYINSLKDVSARTDLSILLKSCMDASQSFIDFENVKNNDYNYFVIEMLNGASLPSRKNGWDKTQKGLSNLEMHFGKHPDWDWRIENVETAGQGTTSMNYYLWNLRWRIDKSNGDDKKVNAQYLESRTVHQGSYQYYWGDTQYTKTIKFDGSQHPKLKRMTAKINFASSMQSHKIGATRAYTDLHNAVELTNEAQTYAANNSLPKPTVAVYEYPAFGFQKIGNTYEFIGLFTIGPDKGDKPTFGYDINDSIKAELISIEGTDHSRKMVMFNYPWNSDVQYLSSNECLNIVKGASDYDNGWEVSNCHDLSTDKATDQAAIQEALEYEFKPAYEIAYLNSTLIIGIPLGTYGATAAATISYINGHIAEFQSLLDSDNRMTYANYQFWIEGEYDVYYYDIKDSIYKKNGQNLVTQCGNPQSGLTVEQQNEFFKGERRMFFMSSAENFWDIQDTLFHYCFIVMFGAMDNFGKNTYPYKMATFAHGGRWKWRQDDLDSILGIGNAGADNMPDWIEFQDSVNGSVYFGGSTSVFWNLIHECYYDDYISTVTSATTGGILTMGKNIMEAMSSLAGGTNTYDGVMKFMKRYFWDNAQNYFPQSAYDADAALKYEAAWLANGQEVPPLTQSLGNHYEAEKYWSNLRMIYMMSLFKAGAFGSYADTSLGQIAFRPQSLQSLTVTPYTELYPAFASGQGMVSTARTKAFEEHTFVGPFGTDGQTSHYINAANMLVDLGDLKDLQLGAQYINNLQIQGKKLIKFKIGDENADIIITPAVYYTQEECDAYNAEHGLYVLPEGYTQVEYLKSNGSQYINTEVNCSSLDFNIEIECFDGFVSRFGWVHNNVANGTWLVATNDKIFYKNWNTYKTIGNIPTGQFTIKYDSKTGFYINNSSVASFTASLGSDSISNKPMWILNPYDFYTSTIPTTSGSGGTGGNSNKIGIVKISVDGVLVRKMIPARNGSTACMYDIINDTTYYSSNGSLLTGNDKPKALTINDIKIPAVTIPTNNVTTNVPSLSFDNTYCLEEVDARNAESLTQTVDLSVCRRLKKAYFEGTSLSQVRLQNGSKIEELHLPNSTTIIQLRNLKRLLDENLVLPTDLTNITQLQVLNCDLDTLGMLHDIYETDDNSLGYFNIAMSEPKEVGMDYLEMLVNIKENKDKNGEPLENGYHGISPDGQTLDTANPTIDGTFLLTSGFYQQDMDALALTNIEPYEPDTTKNIGLIPHFSALYAVFDPTKIYYRFIDPEVNRVVANAIGDGVGTTMAQITSCTSIGSLLDNNTDALVFDDFELFTGLTGTVSDGFVGTSLTSIKCPNGVNLSASAFKGNTSISNLHVHGNFGQQVGVSEPAAFEGDGILIVDGDITSCGTQGGGTAGSYSNARFIHYIVKRDVSISQVSTALLRWENVNALTYRVGRNFNMSGSSQILTHSTSGYKLKMFEVMGNLNANGSGTGFNRGTFANTLIMHLGKTDVAGSSNLSSVLAKFTKVYVGSGVSRVSDEATLALYLADSNWSSYSSKLATWYDYNGECKWYYVTDVLTNCTNTNPDEWPHITRGEEYKTTIVANEGYTLNSVKVEMYSARDNALTPDEPTDITSSVYNSSTGEIYIQEVVGNVIITASAS